MDENEREKKETGARPYEIYTNVNSAFLFSLVRGSDPVFFGPPPRPRGPVHREFDPWLLGWVWQRGEWAVGREASRVARLCGGG